MTESQFIKDNIEDWQELEDLLKKSHKDADLLNRLFIKVSSDLSYARTYYPNRMVRVYLNALVEKVLDIIKSNNKTSVFSGVKTYFTEILPHEVRASGKSLLISLIVFLMAMMIGVYSAANDKEFVKQMLGPDYVSMTEANIAKGDPMAVYKKEGKFGMASRITINNIQVAFFAFLFGIIGGIGTLFILISNGIMIGAFQYFFYEKGLWYESFTTIYIHGALELSAIVVAGGAGLILGNGWLNPSTYRTSTSLRINAKRSLRILLSTVPLFIIAGTLEGFVTRLTEMPDYAKWTIILVSFAVVIWFYIIFTFYCYNEGEDKYDITARPEGVEKENQSLDKLNAVAEGLVSMKIFMARIFGTFMKIILPILILLGYLFAKLKDFQDLNLGYARNLYWDFDLATILTYWVLSSVLVYWFTETIKNPSENLSLWNKGTLVKLASSLLIMLPLFLGILLPIYIFVGLLFLIPLTYQPILLMATEDEGRLSKASFDKAKNLMYKGYGSYMFFISIVIILFLLLNTVFHSSIYHILYQVLLWHDLMQPNEAAYLLNFVVKGFMIFTFCIGVYAIGMKIFQINVTKSTSNDIMLSFTDHLRKLGKV